LARQASAAWAALALAETGVVSANMAAMSEASSFLTAYEALPMALREKWTWQRCQEAPWK
jgi:hypothetical protein